MPADVNVALLRGGNSMGSRGIKEAIKNETVHVVSVSVFYIPYRSMKSIESDDEVLARFVSLHG